MHSLLSRTILCVALTLPAFAFAQTAEPSNPTPAATPSATPASAATTQTEARPIAPAPATTDTTKQATTAGKIGAPPAGKGQVVFFRVWKFVGGGMSYKVREGTTELGKLGAGKYFVAVVEPGTHEYTVHSEAKDILTLEVEPGETYYVQGSLSMGVMVGRPNISPSDQATFDSASAKLKIAN